VESWRDTTSQLAQDDFEALTNTCLELAEGHLTKSRAFIPFHCALNASGELRIGIVEPADSNGSNMVQDNRAVLQSARADLRACAVTYDVRLPELDTDAIRIDLEHSDRATLTIIVPYSFKGIRRRVVLGDMQVSRSPAHIWTEG
jgi:hypothetical protein